MGRAGAAVPQRYRLHTGSDTLNQAGSEHRANTLQRSNSQNTSAHERSNLLVINGCCDVTLNFLYSASHQRRLTAVIKAEPGKAAVTPPVTDCVQVSVPEASTQFLLPEPPCQGFTHALQPPPRSKSQQQGPGSEAAPATSSPRSWYQSMSTITAGLETAM